MKEGLRLEERYKETRILEEQLEEKGEQKKLLKLKAFEKWQLSEDKVQKAISEELGKLRIVKE